MQRGYRYISSLFLAAALAAPVVVMAAAAPQENRQEDRRENRDNDNNLRYYDRSHKDYHTWDSNEEHAYQRYQTEHHQKRAFVQLNTRQQTVYWGWRHNNPDNR
ncbi:MAG TPA: hypothetical protein VFK06_07340 [Candidatus Angelobacter sp.]|nr:hypothetical protein [Candidatus Angelobacter sp.]